MGPPILDRDGMPVDVFPKGHMPLPEATYQRSGTSPAGPSGRQPRRRGAAGARFLPALLLALLALLPASALGASSTLVIEGAGDGHGVGMSQEGAVGYAKHGYTYQQILAHYYTGTTIGQAPAKTVVKVLVGSKVHRVPLERYVRGVIGNEMSPSAPPAALEAQAIASRSYALTAHAGGSRFDVYSDTRSQVYRAAAAETASTNAAVTATAGQVVLYAGKPVATYFFASSGGMTESIQNGFPGSEAEPWLVGVADAYEGSASRWKVELPFATAAHRLSGLYKGTFHGIEVLARGVSPRVLTARVLGTKAASVVSGPTLAGRLGLASTWEYFDVRSGTSVKQEPDHSGQHRSFSPTVPAAPPPTLPPEPAPSGGVAPTPVTGSSASASSDDTGGTEAP
jgi:SpoIID/LytB domain protein